MAKQRIQVPDLAQAPQLSPVARPVDIFHESLTPIPGKRDFAGELAQGLSALHPALKRYTDIKFNQAVDDSLDEGSVAALAAERESNKAGLKKAVEAGVIPAGANPWFKKGWKEQKARIAGLSFDRALKESYVKSTAAGSDDPAELDKFMQGYTQEFIKNSGMADDPDYQSVLVPMVNQSTASLSAQHTSRRQQIIEAEVKDNTYREIGAVLNDHSDPVEAGALIEGRLTALISTGLNGTDANRIAVDAIGQQALESLDTDLLNTLDNIKAGSGMLGKTQYAREQREIIQQRIWSKISENSTMQNHLDKTQREDATRTLMGEANGLIVAGDYGNPRFEEIRKELNGISPEDSHLLDTWRASELSNDVNISEDQETIDSLEEAVYTGNGSIQAVIKARRAGLISAATRTRLASDVEKSKDMRSLMKDPLVYDVHRTLGQIVRKAAEAGGEGNDLLARRAQNIFLKNMATWQQEHADATNDQLQDYAQKQEERLLKRFAPAAESDATAASDVPLDVEEALLAPEESINWQTQPVMKLAEIKAAVAEFNASGGKSGAIVALAAKFGADPREFARIQEKLIRGNGNAKPKPTK